MIQLDRVGANRLDDQTYQEMLVWYRKAAAQGYPPAFFNLVDTLRDGSKRDRQEAERWSNHIAEESKRWRTAYGDLSLSASTVPVPMSAGWRDDAWSKTVVDAELERCKRYISDQGALDSAGECFLHAYTLGVIRARHYLEDVATRHNVIGQLYHASGQLALAENENLKSATLYEAIGDVAAAGPIYANLAAISKRKGDRMKTCKYAFRSRDLLTAADNQSMLQDANTFIQKNCQ